MSFLHQKKYLLGYVATVATATRSPLVPTDHRPEYCRQVIPSLAFCAIIRALILAGAPPDHPIWRERASPFDGWSILLTVTAGGLSPGERATLRCVCTALLPALQPEAGDDPRLFTLAAGDLGVPAAMEQAIGSLDPAQQEQFRQLLRALEQPAMIGLLTGTARDDRATDRHIAALQRP
jgi:hypothetical protein